MGVINFNLGNVFFFQENIHSSGGMSVWFINFEVEWFNLIYVDQLHLLIKSGGRLLRSGIYTVRLWMTEPLS